MEAKELRIGNFLNDAKGKLAVVEKIEKDNYIAYSGIVTFLPLERIPLTHEWFLKFGFNYDGNWHYNIGENPLTMDYLLDITWIEGDKYPFYRNGYFKIKYVHQLQNLFFSLTRDELTVSS